MKRISDIPNITKEMKAIYGKIWASNGNFKAILPLLDKFLKKYPYYTEAWVLKARALMGIGRNAEAMRCLKTAKRIDEWKLIGRFDEAEIYLEKRKQEESIKIYVDAVKAYAVELKNGLDGYHLCLDSKRKAKIVKLTKKALNDFFTNDDKNRPFERLKKEFTKMKSEFRYY